MDNERGRKISPSILSADFMQMGRDIQTILDGGADFIHVDVMDGIFVPNISMGMPMVKGIHKAFPAAVQDVHLMIDRPLRYVDDFAKAGADMLTFHVESDTPENIGKAIARTHELGMKAGLSVKPGTSAEAIAPWLKELDLVLVMTVEPGFSGQSFMADQMDKMRTLRGMIDRENPACLLSVDGGVNLKTAPLAVAAGADVLAAASAVFGSDDPKAAIAALRAC